MNDHVILCDDDYSYIHAVSELLEASGFNNVAVINDERKLLSYMHKHQHDYGVVVLDLFMPHHNGDELLPEITKQFPQYAVIMLTGNYDISTVVKCMRIGAINYLTKPLQGTTLVQAILHAVETKKLNANFERIKNHLLGAKLKQPKAFEQITTVNQQMLNIMVYAECIATTDGPVLLLGETGTGKELLARAIHNASERRGDFVAVNVAGLDDAIFADTLFGHVKGAFTGADRQRDGMIAKAAGGTLFLDEIGDLSPASQVKLLRLLQEREYYPVGSDVSMQTDAKIIVATHKDLDDLARNNSGFRLDLLYRLKNHQIKLPPLRNRKDDIHILTTLFVQDVTAKNDVDLHNNAAPEITSAFMEALLMYEWPGNVRELKNTISDAISRSVQINSNKLTIDCLPLNIATARTGEINKPGKELMSNILTSFGRFPSLNDIESWMIDRAMELCQGNITSAASILGITRQTLHNKLNKKHDKA